MSKLQTVLKRINEVNSQDPNQTSDLKPHELVYSEQLTSWVFRLNPNPSEPLQIAARGQHIARWMIPRERYEKNRVGYLLWREELKKFHAKKVSEIMREAGYSDEEIQKTASIILKKNLRHDADAQTLEDALCLLFIETEFEDLKQKTEEPKMIEIVRKTWKKMSGKAQALALSLDLPKHTKKFLNEALTG